MCDNSEMKKKHKGDEDLIVTEWQEKLRTKNHTKKTPHLKKVHGKVEIDSKKLE